MYSNITEMVKHYCKNINVKLEQPEAEVNRPSFVAESKLYWYVNTYINIASYFKLLIQN